MGYLNQSCYQDRWCSTILAKCDEALTGSCIFLSTAVELNSTKITFKLYGEFSGYIAVGFSADDQMGGNDAVYACANDNGALKLIHATMLNNSTLTQINSPTQVFVGGFVIGSMIHCMFTVNDPKLTTVNSSQPKSFYIFLFSGNFYNGECYWDQLESGKKYQYRQ
ncbi:hypothetical protein MHYP_G00242260 [Metynnis hypsauchen]